MNLEELKDQPTRPIIHIGPNWLKPLFNYRSLTGVVPTGAQITITGYPGTGKTRLGLQLLDHIGKINDIETHFVTYESTAEEIADLATDLNLRYVQHISFSPDKLELKPQCVYLIDSADFWAGHEFNEPWPTQEMAQILIEAKKKNTTVIMIHHATKNGKNKLSGSQHFRKLNDVIIDLWKRSDNKIVVSTLAKNRWASGTETLLVQHTTHGLVPVPPPPSILDTFKKFIKW